jgi:predicted glycoside hydrolase/deacetylase ChbG (UPF0249 family)
LTGRIKRADIEREFRAQIEKCLLAGIKPTHLDSHQHTHAFPFIFPLAVRVANDYAVPGIRIPRGVPSFRDLSASRFLGKCILCLLAQADANLFPLGQCRSTQHFEGLFESGALGELSLLRILATVKPGVTELVCHPGCEDSSPRYQSWNKRRQVELAALTSDSVKQTIHDLGIEITNYRQL